MKPPPRIDGESAAHYRYFVLWLRVIGPEQIGSNRDAARELDITPSKLATMKSRHRWVQRRTESHWDAEVLTEASAPALTGEIVTLPPAGPPPVHDMTERDLTTRGAIEWREHLLAGVTDMAAAARAASRVTRAYYESVDKARRQAGHLTAGEQPEPCESEPAWPDDQLRDAAMLALRSFWSPAINEQVAGAHTETPTSQRADTLSLTHPDRARDAYAALAERIGSAGAITDPRDRSASTD